MNIKPENFQITDISSNPTWYFVTYYLIGTDVNGELFECKISLDQKERIGNHIVYCGTVEVFQPSPKVYNFTLDDTTGLYKLVKTCKTNVVH